MTHNDNRRSTTNESADESTVESAGHVPVDELSEADKAVLLHERALELCPLDHPNRPAYLNNLAATVLARFNQSRNRADLDRTVSLLGQALELYTPDHPNRSTTFDNLDALVFMRFKQLGNRADLDTLVRLHEQALELYPSSHPGRSIALNKLAARVWIRFDHSSNPADLDWVVHLREQVLELRPHGHPFHSGSLIDFATSLLTRFKQSGNPADLNSAVQLYERALDIHPRGHPNHSASLDYLADALLARFRQSGNCADLDRAVLLREQALEHHPPNHPDHSMSLNNLASPLLTRFKQSGNRADLETAVQLHEQALRHRPPGHPDRSASLTNLANAILVQFELSGNRADLDRAVLLHKQALELCSPADHNRAAFLNNLATSVLTRYKHSGDPDDLNWVIRLHGQALNLRPPGHLDRPTSLNNIADTRLIRFSLLKDRADVDMAVHLLEQTLELCPSGHPDHVRSLSNLATSILTQFEESGTLADLDKAVRLYDEALECLPPTHPDHLGFLNNLANALLTRFKQSGDDADLEQALNRCNHGLKTASETDKHLSDLFLMLGRVYAAKFHSSQLPSDLEQALDALARGAHAQHAPSLYRFTAAMQWLITAVEFDRRQSAITACRVVITLLPQLLWLELDLLSRLASLRRAAGLICNGAACALHESNATEAVELLEGGRGVLWTYTSQLRRPFVDLPAPFAQNLADLSSQLRAMDKEDSFLKQSLNPEESAAENVHRRELVVKWSQTLGKVRNTQGFDHFLLPRPFRELAEAAKGGPIIILNASTSLGCDAVVLKSHHSSPEHVALPNITFARLAQLQAGLKWKTRRDTARYMELAAPESDLDFPEILEELWISVAKPIVDFLGLERSENPKERLWWCPTGLFTFMPIHAAGIYHPNRLILTCMSEYAISSYIPTLDALITARARPVRKQADKVLVIIQPETPGLKPLPCTVEEREHIQKVVPAAAFLHLSDSASTPSTKDGSDATVQNVLSRLPEASIVHFACHGTQKWSPLKSALYLQDGQLTLDRLMHQDLPNASIAFLSACHSAAGDEEQPDEIVHLGAGMLAAGYQSVIATMWSMGDQDGPLVAEEVYRRLFSSQPDPTCTAHALHTAVRKLRETRASFAAWVPFIHLGV